MKPTEALAITENVISHLNEAGRVEYAKNLLASGLLPLGEMAVAQQVEAQPATPDQPEKLAKANKLISAMAEKFGVKEDDFSLLGVETETGNEQMVAAYTAPNGIDLGDPAKDYDEKRSWDAIFDKKAKKSFIFTVGGQEVDSRKGMTWATYQTFIANAKDRGIDPLPDSRQLADQNGQVWTDTWLTGEPPADGEGAWVAYVDGGRPDRNWYWRGGGDVVRRFRPAVVIE